RLFRNEIDVLYNELSELTNNKGVNERNQLIFRILYETGCRIGEVLGLRIMDYRTPNQLVKVGFIQIKMHIPFYNIVYSYKMIDKTVLYNVKILELKIIENSTQNQLNKVGFIQIKRHIPLYHKDHSIKTNERDIPVSIELIYAIDEYVINTRPYNEE